jgi:hypothetical protein
MPRLFDFVSESVWRVPNATSFSIVAWSSVALTGSAISRVRA